MGFSVGGAVLTLTLVFGILSILHGSHQLNCANSLFNRATELPGTIGGICLTMIATTGFAIYIFASGLLFTPTAMEVRAQVKEILKVDNSEFETYKAALTKEKQKFEQTLNRFYQFIQTNEGFELEEDDVIATNLGSKLSNNEFQGWGDHMNVRLPRGYQFNIQGQQVESFRINYGRNISAEKMVKSLEAMNFTEKK